MSGKGSAARPLSVDTQTFAARWEATFTPTPPPELSPDPVPPQGVDTPPDG